ncbi:hypothetical protein MHUMG1_09137 [Metarhizium humberi]|uniref:Uncharacterized protein n=1 Tax=Metarhizium humberi TaxID=2596975 RepID=A0A9P8M3M9_9HYPO|nr:hypothetical protein MHUMG1_09137 [Metarhizium humberi]
MSTFTPTTYTVTDVSALQEIPDRKETSIPIQRPFSVFDDVSRLNEKITNHEDGFEPMSSDVRHYTLTTTLETSVGIHVYPANKPATQLVIFNHGNIRPSRYMNEILEKLTHDRTRVVIAVDFVGYDSSSRVPNKAGALEIASIINDTAAYQYATDEYPNVKEVIYCSRSLGNIGWTHCIHFPKVTKVVALMPFADLSAVAGSFASSQVRRRIFFPFQSLAQYGASAVLGAVFPSVFPSDARVDGQPDVQTRGFSLVKTIDALAGPMEGKSVLLMKASDDELIPDGEAERLAAKLEEKGIKTKVMDLTGSHHALPWDEKNEGSAPKAMEEFFANGL